MFFLEVFKNSLSYANQSLEVNRSSSYILMTINICDLVLKLKNPSHQKQSYDTFLFTVLRGVYIMQNAIVRGEEGWPLGKK